MIKLFFMIVGTVLGSRFNSPFLGFLVGWYVGSLFSRSLRMNSSFMYQSPLQTQFFKTTFSVMGYIAKADGHVSESEINAAKHVMSQLKLNNKMKNIAIESFRFGKSKEFYLDQQLQSLVSISMLQPELVQLFMDIQWMAARADGYIGPNKQRILEEIAQKLGIHQQRSYNRASSGSSQTNLSAAYKTLGVNQGDSEAVIKKAYRKMIGKYHPDRMVSKGLPDEMIRMANKKSQEIKEAYDMIRQSRGF